MKGERIGKGERDVEGRGERRKGVRRGRGGVMRVRMGSEVREGRKRREST